MSITLTTIDVFSADIAWKPVPPTPLPTGTGSRSPAFNASNLVYRKEQMLAPMPAHMGANAVFNRDEVRSGAPRYLCRGVKASISSVRGSDAGPIAGRRLF